MREELVTKKRRGRPKSRFATKTRRTEIRLTDGEMNLVKMACELSGFSITELNRNSLLRAASEIIERNARFSNMKSEDHDTYDLDVYEDEYEDDDYFIQ